MAAYETEPPPAHPGAKSRRRVGTFIAVFLGLQFLVPLTYLARQDPSDERFTWRSLATAETLACETSATAKPFDGEPVPLEVDALLHQDWVRYIQLGRQSVVDAFLVSQCERDSIEEVELVNRCPGEQGTRRFRLRCGGERALESSQRAAR